MEIKRSDGKSGESNTHGALLPPFSSLTSRRGPVFGAVSPLIMPERASKSHAVLSFRSGISSSSHSEQQHDHSLKECATKKDIQASDGNFAQENQKSQSISPSQPLVFPEYLVPHTQLELGQPVAPAAFAFSDPYFGIMTAYCSQAMVHPQLLGMPHPRMPLPLEMAEEPVYVNAKQYHGILRRRQSRAKAELENKIIKNRKPYLHESRHLHAMKRARGCGGRFLNTKKSDADASKTNPESEIDSASGSSGFVPINPDSAAAMPNERTPMLGILEQHKCTIGHDDPGFGFHLCHSNQDDRFDEENFSGERRAALLMNQANRNRALAI